MDYNLKEKMNQYIDSGFPILYLNTFEEEKADKLILELAHERKVYEWNETSKFVDAKYKRTVLEYELVDFLLYFSDPDVLDRNIIVLKDIHSYLEDKKIVSLVKGLVRLINSGTVEATIIMISSILLIPNELEKFVNIFEMDYPEYSEIEKIIDEFTDYNDLDGIENSLKHQLSISLKGLTEFEINNLLALAYSNDGYLDESDLSIIYEQKRQMIKKAGILEMITVKETMNDIGGLENLKQWLKKKAKVFKNIDEAKKFGVDVPKGVLVAGLPGCGKSLNAKAASRLFDVPLLRLDMGRLMGKYVGESESNLRKAIALAEAISPCILWIDELEKAFAGINGGGGSSEVSTRLFGNFLTWLQEKESTTFVVATANDISNLPPELLRKGRFDEVFYVGLPNKQERKKIFEIHLKKRSKTITEIDFDILASKTEGYSGADIEGVVKEAIEEAFYNDKDNISTEDIFNVIKETNSLSEIMKDSIEKLTKIYKEKKMKNASKEI